MSKINQNIKTDLYLLYLHSKFSCGTHNERLSLTQLYVSFLKYCYRECGSFTSTRLRLGYDVSPSHYRNDGSLLDS